MKVSRLVVYLAALLPTLASAQTAHVHPNMKLKVLDGATNPELIPDSEAYRMFFTHFSTSANPSTDEASWQSLKLASLGLSPADRLKMITILRDFRDRQDSLIERFNQQATAAEARGVQTSDKILRQQLDDLVTSARFALKTLASTSASNVDAAVQSGKKSISVHTAEAQ